MIVLISIFDTIVNLYKPRIPGQLYQICIKITIFNISRRDKNKERAKSQRLSSFFVLPWKEKRLVGSTTQPMEIRPQHQLSYALSPGLIFISSALLVIPCSFSVLTVCTISFGKVTRPAICISAPPCPNVHFRLVCKVK